MANSNSIITIGTMDVLQKNVTVGGYPYGNALGTTKVTVGASKSTVTLSATCSLKAGDVIHVLPYIQSGTTTTVSGDLVLDITYFKSGVGFTSTQVTVTYATGLAETITAINTAVNGFGVKATLNTGVILLQATVETTTFKVNALTDASYMFTEDAYAKRFVFKVIVDPLTATVSTKLINGEASGVVALADYKVYKSIGEGTGVNLESSLDPVIYKGTSKYAKQVEYAEGSAKLTVDELTFQEDTLDYVFGLTKTANASFFSGKTSASIYSYTLDEITTPASVELVGLHAKIDGGMIMFLADKAKTNNLDFSMKKAEYRINSQEFTLMTPTASKAVWTLINI